MGFNVTEDLELSVVGLMCGLKTHLATNVVTEEGCVITLKDWFGQRTRWMKGYILTYFTYFKYFVPFKNKNLKEVLFFHFVVGFVWIFFAFLPLLPVSFVIFRDSNSEFIRMLSYFYFFLSMIYYFLIIFYYLGYYLINKRKFSFSIVVGAIFYPFYFFLHFIAVYLAIWDIFKRPFYWKKTEHSQLNTSSEI